MDLKSHFVYTFCCYTDIKHYGLIVTAVDHVTINEINNIIYALDIVLKCQNLYILYYIKHIQLFISLSLSKVLLLNP